MDRPLASLQDGAAVLVDLPKVNVALARTLLQCPAPALQLLPITPGLARSLQDLLARRDLCISLTRGTGRRARRLCNVSFPEVRIVILTTTLVLRRSLAAVGYHRGQPAQQHASLDQILF